MKLKLISILTLALVAGAVAQTEMQKPVAVGILSVAVTPPPITVAVFDFDSPSTGPNIRNDLAITTSLIMANLSTNPSFNLVERADLQKILDEEAFGKSGNIKPDSAARIGQLTGAKILVDGQFLLVSAAKDISTRKVMIIANIIGTETGRVFIEKVEGVRFNELELISDLSEQIAQTIVEQSTNLIASATNSPEEQLDKVIAEIKGKPQLAVSIKINGTDAACQIAQNELGLIFQKAGFTVVDEKSDQRPDILISGDAIAATDLTQGNLFSGRATLEIKAQERTTGKILALDLQQGVAVDIGGQTAADMALKNATDDLAERILPLLAK